MNKKTPRVKNAVDFHQDADISIGLKITHLPGIIIRPNISIGENLFIGQSVTLGLKKIDDDNN